MIPLSRFLMALAALILSAPQALAQSAPTISPPPLAIVSPAETLETPAEALAADALEYGRTFGVAPAESLRRMEAQEASVALTDRLAAEYADRLAGIVIEHAPTYRIVITVSGPPAPETQIALAPFGVPVILRTGAISTRAQTLEAIERHQAELREELPYPPGMGVDPRTGALLILIRPGDLRDEAGRVEMASHLAGIAGVPVELKSWGEVDSNLSAEGGGALVNASSVNARRSVCTSGFVVTDGIRTGLSTAAHCPDALDFADHDGTRVPLTMIGAWGARYQDVQIHVADTALQPIFHAESDARARMALTWRNRASTRAGDVVCHRGQRTGYSCSIVRIVDYAPPGDLCAGACPPTWVAVSGPACKGGDSGGPVFLGTTAFGLVKGESSESGTCKLYFYMSVDYLPPGWTVMHADAGLAPRAPPAATIPFT